ncbi:MAG: class I SAM-dependent methyltransferase [Bacteroidales bacterium]|mgnify:FL=1|jgi:23S rRNA (cytosine1962-C5)-methyltransferase|nr:class I SAM-dependent methyltransferase [Bacteroidales bacterium]HKM12011.1 hypothetical protein [Bacteroidales bacterium]HPH52739.1 RsmD family RNA methyltransferase [Bacteroidales bacterium]
MTIEYPSPSWRDYELIDSGNFEKLERFGRYVMIRPEQRALWERTLPEEEWLRCAHTKFAPGAGLGKAGKEDSGSWSMLNKMDKEWMISYPKIGFDLRLKLTSFKHIGLFPEQAPNWDYIYSSVKEIAVSYSDGTPPRVLNLFAYTGAASLAARKAGAEVTHLDSVRQVVTWARGNMESSGFDNIRWIIEDALLFVKREARRGNLYHGIILDPPAYGYGPDGERWKLNESIYDMLLHVASILAQERSFIVLNLYSNGYSPAMAETLVSCAFGKKYRSLECGELVLKDSFGKILPMSVFARLKR